MADVQIDYRGCVIMHPPIRRDTSGWTVNLSSNSRHLIARLEQPCMVETVRKVVVRWLVEASVVPSAQLQRSLARGCRSLRRFEPSTSYALPAATSASADSRPSGDEAAIARCFPSAPSILAPRRDAPPRSR